MTRETATTLELLATYGIADATGLITNTVEIDLTRPVPDIPGLFVPPPGVVPVIGGHWDGRTVTPPPPPAEAVPASIALWRARAILRMDGLIDIADAAVAASGNAALIEVWQYGNEISRSSPGLASLATVLHLADAQVDQMFIRAAALVV